MAHQNISKKRKFVADGVFYSELNEVRIRPRTAYIVRAPFFLTPYTHALQGALLHWENGHRARGSWHRAGYRVGRKGRVLLWRQLGELGHALHRDAPPCV